jgi:hypothetical protein
LGDVDITWEDIRSYNLDEHYNVSRSVVVDFFYKPFSDESLESCISPVLGAYETLQKIKDQ